ncbi:MAG TPA: hypothetical protein VE981_05030 [Planctomycetota bacterium]|nr:hypothetical protein [Planctomycetota bacterium]
MTRCLFSFLVLLAGPQAAQDDRILERADQILEEAKAAYESARETSSVVGFVDAGFKLEEARIKYFVVQEIGSPEKQKLAADRLRAVNQLSKLIHDGKTAISGKPGDAPVKPEDPAPVDPVKPAAPAPAPAAVDVSKRASVPDAARQKEAEKLLKDLYKEQYAKKAPADRLALARTLLDQARKSKDDPVSVWVCCREAQDLAAQVCDVRTLTAAIDETARVFDIDPLPARTAGLAAAGKAVKSAEEAALLAMALDKLIDELLAADQYDAADKAAASALQFARKSNDVRLAARATARAKDVTEAKSRFQSMKNVLQTLAKTPEDAGANSEMGQFLCFVKGNWDLGLRFVVKGSDAGMKALAEKELGLASNPADLAAVADGWYDLGEKEKAAYRKSQLLGHARTLYEVAVNDAVGLARARIEKRLDQIQTAIGLAPGGAINLLRLIDLKKDAIAGDWKLDGTAVVSDASDAPRIEFPYQPPEEYDFRIVFTRRGGEILDVFQILAGGGKQFLWLSGGKNGVFGFGMVQGKWAPQPVNPTFVRGPTTGVADVTQTSLVEVRKDGVKAYLDGKLISQWKVYSDFSMNASYALRDEKRLGIGTYRTVTAFQKIEVVEVTGKGKLFR